MSKNVYLFGDCHLSRVQEHYNDGLMESRFWGRNEPEIAKTEMKFWGKAGTKIWGLDLNKLYEDNALSSGHESCPAKDVCKCVTEFRDIKDDGIVMVWLGYIDVRQFLSKYNNAEDVVNHYIKSLKEYFKSSTIVIIEPLPQFTEMLLKHEGISISYTYEQRLNQNDKFISILRSECAKENINFIISQEEIRKAIGRDELTPEMTHNKAPHPVDGLQDEYNKRIYELFESYAIKFKNTP
jgi:hypothetical protein